MNNLNDLINLAKADGGKFFIMDEQGNASLVIMPVEEYQKLLIGKLQKQMQDVEAINKEILKAQMNEETSVAQSRTELKGYGTGILKAQLTEGVTPTQPLEKVPPATPETDSVGQMRVGPTVLTTSRKDLFNSRPANLLRYDGNPVTRPGAVDLREEVIDPSFDFEGPKFDVDDI